MTTQELMDYFGIKKDKGYYKCPHGVIGNIYENPELITSFTEAK